MKNPIRDCRRRTRDSDLPDTLGANRINVVVFSYPYCVNLANIGIHWNMIFGKIIADASPEPFVHDRVLVKRHANPPPPCRP